ncbi:hypothetical protein RchiOBHm_Chr7g0208531 [Rosa chinensis]|uniref:Rapid ALkalinization Factor n=1 Tax=Rosa chinensis TaxID=74649 RepID=A0A2P6P9Q4_ROSCH|nr:hypothetical protein RchiOBHm_Chr7g0208531 [Rosa chinensis]
MRLGVAKMSGHSSSAAALLAMMVVMMTMSITKTDCFSIDQTITVSSTWCDGLNDDLSCLTRQTDLDSDEFMLDSEFSRSIWARQEFYSSKTLNPATAVSCDRKGFPSCLTSGKNKNPPAARCNEAPTNRDCYRYN